jgi:hypothetical protein
LFRGATAVLIEEVKKLTPAERLMYWIKERHEIHRRREAGNPRPWTDDQILRHYFFTNPFRENDKTTQWFKSMVRGPLACDPAVVMATVIFRWFNYIPTGQLLLREGLLTDWDEAKAARLLVDRWDEGKGQVFTGAYMIKAGNGPRGCKIPSVCRAISNVWASRRQILDCCLLYPPSMQRVWGELKRFPFLGGFMSYEIVCDLRWTHWLTDAVDRMTWCNPGPGARRGLNRLLGRQLEAPFPQSLWEEHTRLLLGKMIAIKLKDVPHPVEMREVEHSSCEWDKYERLLWGQGRSKRRYNGAG